MKTYSLLNRLGFTNNDLEKKPLSFLLDCANLSTKLDQVFYYNKGKSEQVKTRFYWIKADNISSHEIKIIHERIWNENKADLLFIEQNDLIEIKYISTNPKEDLLDITSIPTNVEDDTLLNKISKEHITTGAFWIEYNDTLDRIKKQHKTVDQALIESLSSLRKELDEIYLIKIQNKELRSKTIQALIDRTLFIKFLEDKNIINSFFYEKHFGSENIKYKDILQQKDSTRINNLFCKINEVFNNKLFIEPIINDDVLIDSALMAIYQTISGTKNGQLSLFDFQFDIIPIEFISHIYQVFLDDKKSEQGIFYTPEGLAKLLLDNTILKEGKVLDPSCGSGIFLVLAFRKMYKQPTNINDTYAKIQHRLEFIKNNIFGIEIENTATRLAVFSLYLEVLNGITPEELKLLINDTILSKNNTPLFSIDFNENIQESNALIEGEKSPFYGQIFNYIIGNPPWFSINKDGENKNDIINYSYWEKYKAYFTKERQISQCFLHKIKSWSTEDTKFGFIVNSSNFINESDEFQKFVYSTYRIEKFFELYHIKEILFDYADEPACLLLFDNKVSDLNNLQYFLPRLNCFAKTFKTILINQNDVSEIKQADLLNKEICLRDFLIGTKDELLLANKLEKNCKPMQDFIVDDSSSSFRGFEDWGVDALKNEFNLNRSSLSKKEYNEFKVKFLNKYYSTTENSQHIIPFIKSSQLDRFNVKERSTYCLNNINNFHRPRSSAIYEGEKIIFTRIGDQLKAVYSNQKIYFGSDIYNIKLLDNELYHVVTCCLNSELINYFSQIKLKKRIDGAFSRLNLSDIMRLPIPKKINDIVLKQLNELSISISEGKSTYIERKAELNELVFDLYDLDYMERQRISDFFVSEVDLDVLFKGYCEVFSKTFSRVLKTGIVKMEYSFNKKVPIDIVGVNIIFGESTSKQPKINKVQLSINYHLLKQIGSSVLISLKHRIYAEDSIFILKDNNPKNWTKSAAYDDAMLEINKLFY